MELTHEAQQRLKQAREASGLSQSQAATAIGKTKVSVARWECGDRSPREEDIHRLSELYLTDFAWIIDEIGEAPRPTLARKHSALTAFKKMRILQEPLLQDVPETATDEFKAAARANARGSAIIRLPKEYGPQILSMIEAEEGTEVANPKLSAQVIESIAGQLRLLLTIQTSPLTIPDIAPEVIQAIADGLVIPTAHLRKAICTALGIDEARLIRGDLMSHPNQATNNALR
jgi:transcriptional regulator with XRE-family HTH domain